MNSISRSQSILLALVLGLSCAACSHQGNQPAVRQTMPSGQRPKTASEDIWKSETTGNKYRVWIEGKHLYADWVDLPPAAAERGAYIHTVCQRSGSKWVGTSSIFMPCSVGEGKSEHIANTCHLTLKILINSISKDRITGRGQSLRKFDCRSCKVLATGWGNFEWVPAD